MTRWVCARCGSGKLAPERPRADDVRRYCLSCSAATGRLVQRSAPALEARRERRAASRRAATKRTRERERERLSARHTAAGIDVRAEWARLLRLPFVAQRLRDRGTRTVRLTVSRSLGERASGHCKWHGGRVHVTLGYGVTLAELRTLLAHELAHAITPTGEAHGEGWRNTYALVLRDAYGVDLVGNVRGGTTWQLDERVVSALAGVGDVA